MLLNFQISNAINKLTQKLSSWFDTIIVMIPNFLVAIIVLFLFVFVAMFVKKLARKALDKVSDNVALNRIMSSIFSSIIIVIGLFVALGILNLDKTVTSLLAGVGVIGLALGFAFQSSIENFIAGILMAMRYPINVGDIIDTNGIFGTVENINTRYIVIITPEGQTVIIPNRKVLTEILKNYSLSGERRIDLECGISYGDDLDKVKKVVLEAINTIDGFNKDKGIEFFYTGFDNSSINFVTRYWIKYTAQSKYFEARSLGIISIKKAFNAHDITIPFPIRTLDFGIKGGETLAEQINGKLKTIDK